MKSVLFILVFFSLKCFSQTDTATVYFDKNWKEITEDSASFYSIRYQLNDSLWQINDYFIDGRTQMTGTCTGADYANRVGKFRYYSEDGILEIKENYLANGIVSQVIHYYKNGQEDFIYDYSPETGKLISRKFYTENGERSLFTEPIFNGGIRKMNAYISSSLKYPDEARKTKIQGRVLVRFLIEKDGTINELTVPNSVHPLLDEEAMRVISEMPEWIPKQRDGKPLRIYFTLPINFKLY
ncbi:MAG: protein TonB [Arcticibacterium sp.]|jgi:protein TonB